MDGASPSMIQPIMVGQVQAPATSPDDLYSTAYQDPGSEDTSAAQHSADSSLSRNAVDTTSAAQPVDGITPGPPAKITVHWLEQSRAHRILWLLEEMKARYELKTYKRQKSMLAEDKLKEVHSLGKSPVIAIESPATSQPLIIAESGSIVEYLTDYYGKWLVPKRYRDGQEGQIGGESESWLRYRHYMHYAEGSLMPLNVIALILLSIRKAPVPFFLKPITNGVAHKIDSSFLNIQYQLHLDFLEAQLSSSPSGGPYLCGKELTAADIMMSFAVEGAKSRGGHNSERYPKTFQYVDMLYQRDAYRRATERIAAVDSDLKATW